MKQEIYEAVSFLRKNSSSGEILVSPYKGSGDQTLNQFVVFLKPEATAESVKLDEILDIVFAVFKSSEITIEAVRVLSGAFLSKHDVMDGHYGVINRISRTGATAISPDAFELLEKGYSSEIANGAEILGGHQFLERFPEISAAALSVLTDNIGTKKLGGGTYCLSLNVFGQTFLILNPFHPFQLAHYTSPESVIVVLDCRSATPWKYLRHQVAGSTNPLNAANGSIRKILLQRKVELGLKEVSQGLNCVHLSAGPVEGMLEVQRFFRENGNEIPFDDTCFGTLLREKGCSEQYIQGLSSNPSLTLDGRLISVFDLTEDLDCQVAANRLAEMARGK